MQRHWQSGQMDIDDISHTDYRVWNRCHLVDIVIWFDLLFGFKWFGFDFIPCDLICDLPITATHMWYLTSPDQTEPTVTVITANNHITSTFRSARLVTGVYNATITSSPRFYKYNELITAKQGPIFKKS